MPKLLFKSPSFEDRHSDVARAAFARSGLPRGLLLCAAAPNAPAEILLYDEIGYFGVSASSFASALKDAGPGPLNIRINSPGGDVFDGLAIYNMLLARGDVTTTVDGLAASAASYIAMAGDTVNMAESSQMMIHNAWGLAVGNRHDMTQTAGVLAKIDGQLAAIYSAKTGKPTDDVAAMMDAETWMTASEAKDAGFCNAVITPNAKASASIKVIWRSAEVIAAEQAAAVAEAAAEQAIGERTAREKRGRLARIS